MSAAVSATASTGATEARDRDARAADVGTWLFLASLVMFYGALFSGYILLRAGSTTWHTPWLTAGARLTLFPIFQTFALVVAVGSLWRWRAAASTKPRLAIWSVLASIIFILEWVRAAGTLASIGHGPATSVGAASWFVLTGAVAVGVMGGGLVEAGIAWQYRGATAPPHRLRLLQRYWMVMLAFWLTVVVGFYLV